MRSSQARDKSPQSAKDLYDPLHRRFGWQVPTHFNIADVCMRRWAEQPATALRTAVIACAPGREPRHHRYAELLDQANRLSNALAALGVQRGDRVAIVLPQRFETAVAYMAVLQLGAVGMPLSQLFGPDALEYRLHDSEAVVAICDQPSLPALLGPKACAPTWTGPSCWRRSRRTLCP
jgi:acetyl-CoA synthetase